MKETVLFSALAWALACSLAYPCPKSLRVYLAAQLAGSALIQAFVPYGRDSLPFAFGYYIGTAAILAAMLYLLADNQAKLWHVALGFLVAAFVVWRTRAGLAAPITLGDHLSTAFYQIEGGTEAFCGTAILFAAAKAARLDILATLGFLWLALAWFRLGMAMNMYSPLWVRLNAVLPYVFVTGALGWIGIRLVEGRDQAETFE